MESQAGKKHITSNEVEDNLKHLSFYPWISTFSAQTDIAWVTRQRKIFFRSKDGAKALQSVRHPATYVEDVAERRCP